VNGFDQLQEFLGPTSIVNDFSMAAIYKCNITIVNKNKYHDTDTFKMIYIAEVIILPGPSA